MKKISFALSLLVALCVGTLAHAQLTLTGAGRGAPSGGGGGSLTYTQTDTANASGTPSMPLTFSGVNIGTASATRYVVISIDSHLFWPNDLTGVKVNSNPATKAVEYTGSAQDYVNSIWWYGPVASGTTATIEVDGSNGNTVEVDVVVGTITGSAAPSVSSTVAGIPPSYPNGFSNVNTASVSVPANGVAVAVALLTGGVPETATWTNATKDVDLNGVEIAVSGAHLTSSATVTQTPSSGSGGSGWVSASFAP